MKRILFILSFTLVVFESNSQIITNDSIYIDCNSSGYIMINTDILPSFYSWYLFNDSLFIFEPLPSLSGVDADSISFSECGNYRVVIYGASGNYSDTSDFFIPCSMETEVRAQENIKCFGDSTGFLKHVVVGGVPFVDSLGNEYYNYCWQKFDSLLMTWDTVLIGPNDTILMNLFNGQFKSISYKLEVEDSTGCIYQPTDTSGLSIYPVNIFQHDKIRIDSVKVNSVICKGDSTGSLEIWVTGGKRFDPNNSFMLNDTLDGDEYYHYYLLNDLGDTVARSEYPDSLNFSTISSLFPLAPEHVQFSGLSVGNYTIHIIDSLNCSIESFVYIMEPDNYTLHVSTNPSILCADDTTWLRIDSVSGGNANLSYYWKGSTPLADSMQVISGIYTASITDLSGCKDSIEYSLIAPNTIYCDVTSKVSNCFGENYGSLQIDSIYGGVSPYSVQWGGINPDSLYAGIYTLFITDDTGCVYMEDYEVFENSNLELDETVNSPSCFGYSDGSIDINPNGGTLPYTYLWNNIDTTEDLSNLSVGIYSVVITDSLLCTFLDSVVVSEPDDLIIDFQGYTNPLICNGGQTLINAIITGGTPPYSYNWSNLDTMSQIIATAGQYDLIVTDINSCSTTHQILINEPELFQIIDTSFIQATCNLGATASVTASGGTLPYSYIWSNGETTSSASDLDEGKQWVIVTDSCGDIVTDTFEVESYILETTIDFYNNPDNEAIITTLPYNNGSAFYSYQWYDENMNPIPGQTNNILEDLCPTWYYCITTDANNCESIDSVLAELYFPMGGIINESTTTVYDDSLLWGAEPYTYLWDNGDVTAKGKICSGFHRVWVTDINGCEVVGNINVDDILLTLSPSDIIIECDISNLDVELEVSATGGTGDYTYLWSNGQTDNPINLFLNPGVYSVQVTDENLCNEDTVFHIAAMSSDCIPNVFSPNDDGSNDVWNLEDAFFYLDSEIRVYNRYGKLIFKSIGYDTPWNGKNNSGNEVEDGAYFYIIDLGNNIEKIKGTVSIIR